MTWLAVGIVSIFAAASVWHLIDLGAILGEAFVRELALAARERYARIRRRATLTLELLQR